MFPKFNQCSPLNNKNKFEMLLEYYDFIGIPMITIDGVINGHFRDDLNGQNLNRYYKDPCREKQPEIHHIDRLIRNLKQNGQKVEIYIDLHGHLNAPGIFIYGNFYDSLKVFYSDFSRIMKFSKMFLEF